ncbi:MAG: riboflavin synthase, partial [Lachnospiraceae bacterium]
GKIIHIRQDDTAIWYTIQAAAPIIRYIVEKGSITINGISLTVAAVTSDTFSISAIPHTVKMTTLSESKEGSLVNLENDIIGKYVEKLLQPAAGGQKESRITKDFLTKYGF